MTDNALSTPQPRGRPRAGVVLLGLLVVLLVGASVWTIVLFVGAKDEHALEVRHLDRVSRSLTEAEARLAETQTTNDTVNGRIATLQAQNAELHKCADPARDSIIAAKNDDDAALGPAVDRAADNC